MPRLMRLSIRQLWYQPLIYLAVNLALLVFPGLVLLFMMSFGQQLLAVVVSFLIFGAVGAILFVTLRLNKLGVPTGLAVRSFIIVTLAGNAAYILFALGYAKIAGVF